MKRTGNGGTFEYGPIRGEGENAKVIGPYEKAGYTCEEGANPPSDYGDHPVSLEDLYSALGMITDQSVEMSGRSLLDASPYQNTLFPEND